MTKLLMFGRLPRKWRRILVLVAVVFCIYFTISMWNVIDFGYSKVKDPFESRINYQCSIDYDLTSDSSSVIPVDHHGRKFDMCYTQENVFIDVFVSDVYDSISVNYPSWILTVLGWSDTINVPSWTSKPLTVIVLPHSHQDPGWLNTMEYYYKSRTRHTLDYMVEQLTSNPTYKFIWSEVIMLEKWWTTTTAKNRQNLKKLLTNHQLEIVSGGWVMTDESVSHYPAMIDQLIEGHTWLKNTLNVTVHNSWSVDPFGHSSTMAYLLQQSGIQNMVIQRTNYALKRHFATNRHLEFFWRQAWDSKGTTDIFCHMMPFLSYSIPHSCGPDRHVCCKFDFHSEQCFYGNKHISTVEVNDENVKDLATSLWEQLQKKSELYESDVVLMPHGDDFRYDEWDEWKQQFGNLQKIMSYINSQPELNMKIKFGTLKDYFYEVANSEKVRTNSFFPAVSGDFFLYSDRNDQYWSGYYTTRPFFKYLVRQLQQLLRSAEVLFSFTVSQLNWNTNMTALQDKLTSCRRTLALSQHHDAITGTSKEDVMGDFTSRVQSALGNSAAILKESVKLILSKKTGRNIEVNLTEEFFVSNTIPVKTTLNGRQSKRLLIWNDLAQPRNDLVEVVIDMPSVSVVDKDLRHVPFQISPVWKDERKVTGQKYLLTFEINIQPFSLATFVLQPSLSMSVREVATLYSVSNGQHYRIDVSENNLFPMKDYGSEYITLSNVYMTAVFKQCNGMLHSIHRKQNGQTVRSDLHFVTYSTGRKVHPFKDKSGAYTFQPDGVAKELSEQPEVYLVVGNVFSEVRAVYKHVVHTARLYNVSGSLSNVVHLENYVNITTQEWDNYELVMRMETDVIGRNQHFCTDSNGFQMYPRKTRAKMNIQGNVYPMTSAATVEDDDKRVSLLSAQSQGVASLVTGWIEVFLDRRLLQGDWRGLNEGVTDNTLSKSSFYILFEHKVFKEEKSSKEKRLCMQTMQTTFLSNVLNSPLKVFEETIPKGSTVPYRQNHQLGVGFPCDVHILNIKVLSVREMLITLLRSAIDCHFSTSSLECRIQTVPRWSDLLLNVKSITETSLTGVKNIQTIKIQEPIHIESLTIKTYKIILK